MNDLPGGHDSNLLLSAECCHAHNSDQRHHAQITVKPRINDQCCKGPSYVALRRRHFNNQLLQDILNPQSGFSANHQRLHQPEYPMTSSISCQDALRFGRRQINFIQHRGRLPVPVLLPYSSLPHFAPQRPAPHQQPQRSFTGR